MTFAGKINTIAQKLILTLDTPTSVKQQVKEITLAQKELRAIKQELNLHIREINQRASQAHPDSMVSLGLDLFGKRKLAGQV